MELLARKTFFLSIKKTPTAGIREHKMRHKMDHTLTDRCLLWTSLEWCNLLTTLPSTHIKNMLRCSGHSIKWEGSRCTVTPVLPSLSLSFSLHPDIWKNRRSRYEEGTLLVHTTDPENCCQIIYNQRLFNIQRVWRMYRRAAECQCVRTAKATQPWGYFQASIGAKIDESNRWVQPIVVKFKPFTGFI